MHQHLVCPKKWTEIGYKSLQKDEGFTQSASPGNKGSRDQTSPPFPPVKLQAVQNYKFSTFVASYQSMETAKKLISLLADDAQEKSSAQLTLSRFFPILWHSSNSKNLF